MTSTPQYSEQEQIRLIKERRYFSCKKRGHIAYDYLRKGKIATILESISKDIDSHGIE